MIWTKYAGHALWNLLYCGYQEDILARVKRTENKRLQCKEIPSCLLATRETWE